MDGGHTFNVWFVKCWGKLKATARVTTMNHVILGAAMVVLVSTQILTMGPLLGSIQVLPPPCATNQETETPITCQWTVLAGDSNMREVYFSWRDEELQRIDRLVFKRQRKGTLPPRGEIITDQTLMVEKSKCNQRQDLDDEEIVERYSDHEMLIIRGSDLEDMDDQHRPRSCHIVSQRFLRHQNEVERLFTNMTDFGFCGTSLEPTLLETTLLPRGYHRPPHPDTIWISHGLWVLPNEGKHPNGLNCTNRFDSMVKALHTWNSTSNVVWQTLFPIVKHPSIQNDYLRWDVMCHKETALREGLQIFDLASYVENKTAENALYWEDYHLNDETRAFVLGRIFETCCGGKEVYFPP